MRIVGIIPSRMNSSRFPGKALVKLYGIPMICRVFSAAQKSGVFDAVYVATDSPEIHAVCVQNNIPVLITSSEHTNPTSRTAEAASIVKADYYVMIGGDEPLLHPDDIHLVVREGICSIQRGAFAANAAGRLLTESETLDPSNIKIFCSPDGQWISAFRSFSENSVFSEYSVSAEHSVFPNPANVSAKTRLTVSSNVSAEAGLTVSSNASAEAGLTVPANISAEAGSTGPVNKSTEYQTSASCSLRKFVSIGVYSPDSLHFFAHTRPGPFEQLVHFDLLRFWEHQKKISFVETKHHSLSVDTPEDLKHVLKIMETY